jgi:hypothetical protein
VIRGAVPRVLFVGASEVGAQLDDLLAADGRVVESLAPGRVFLALSAAPSPISALVFALPVAQVIAHLERLIPLPALDGARVIVIGAGDDALAELLRPLAPRALHIGAFEPTTLAEFLAHQAERFPSAPPVHVPSALSAFSEVADVARVSVPISHRPSDAPREPEGRSRPSLPPASFRADLEPSSLVPPRSAVGSSRRPGVADAGNAVAGGHGSERPRGDESVGRERGGSSAPGSPRLLPPVASLDSLRPAPDSASASPPSLAPGIAPIASRFSEVPADSVRPSSHPVAEEAAPALEGLGADVPLGPELRALLDAAEMRVRAIELGSVPPRSPDAGRAPDSRRGELPSGRPDLLVSQEALELLEGEGTFGGSRSLTGEASVSGSPGSLPRGTSHGKSSAPQIDPEGTGARGGRSNAGASEITGFGVAKDPPADMLSPSLASALRNERDVAVSIAHVRPPPLPTLDGAEAFLHRADGTSTAPEDGSGPMRALFQTPGSDPRPASSQPADAGTYSPPTAFLRPSVSAMSGPGENGPAASRDAISSNFAGIREQTGPGVRERTGPGGTTAPVDGPPSHALSDGPVVAARSSAHVLAEASPSNAAPSPASRLDGLSDPVIGRPAPPTAPEKAETWSLPRQPAGPLAIVRALGAAIAARADGILCATGATGERRVRLEGGDILAVSSSCPEDALPLFLATEGRLRRDVAQRVAARPAKHPRLVAAALVAEGWLAQDDLWSVLAAHAEAMLVRLLRCEDGTFEAGAFDGKALALDDESPFGGRPGATIFVEAARRALERGAAIGHFGGADARLGGVLAVPLLRECGLPESDERRFADPSATLGQLAGDDEHDVLACILATLGIFRFVVPLTPDGASRPENYSLQADAQAFEGRLSIRLALVEEGDYFAILGVPRSANGYEIRGAYLRLRNDFATHRLDALGLATRRRDVEQVLFVLDEAYEVLRDETKRERYRRAIG